MFSISTGKKNDVSNEYAADFFSFFLVLVPFGNNENFFWVKKLSGKIFNSLKFNIEKTRAKARANLPNKQPNNL